MPGPQGCKMLLGARLREPPVPLGPTFRAFTMLSSVTIENLLNCQFPNSGANESVSFPKAQGGRGSAKS